MFSLCKQRNDSARPERRLSQRTRTSRLKQPGKHKEQHKIRTDDYYIVQSEQNVLPPAINCSSTLLAICKGFSAKGEFRKTPEAL